MGLDEPEYLSMKMEQNINYKWEGKANKMKQVDKLQEVPLNCNEKELKNIIRSTYTPEFRPKILMHGYEFIMKELEIKDKK